MPLPFEVFILGSGSAIPGKHKNHTSQLVSYNSRFFLFDCGEGTQIQLRKYGLSLQKIDHIFISHAHGDHYLGLAGLISSMNLLGREKKLTVYCPPGIRKVIEMHFELANSRSSFPINFVYTQTENEAILYEDQHVTVRSFPVKHKIPTTGFKITGGTKKRKLLRDKIEAYNVPKHLRAGISDGKDYRKENGDIVPNELLTTEPEPFRHYAFCADTIYRKDLVPFLKGVDLMYHEASFLKEDEKKAKEHLHSTAEQAAMIAKEAGAGKLLIGHFSSKYRDDQAFLDEACAVFANTEIAIEGTSYEIK